MSVRASVATNGGATPNCHAAGRRFESRRGPINGMSPSDWSAEKAMQSIRGIRFEGISPLGA
jgi:hypothetical protein